jgi:predicted metalloprotease with PDZ domain
MLRAVIRILAAAAVLLSHLALAAGVPPPRDLPHPGTVQLAVDATDLEHRLFRVHESLPVRPGPLTLLYPKWLPGNHAPTGPIEALAGLIISAGGHTLAWQRDPLDVYVFHVEVPRGVERLDLSFQFISAAIAVQGHRVMTPDLLGLQWEKTLLYPAGYYVRRIPVAAEVTLPPGWSYASALREQSRSGASVRFATLPLEQLVDAPLFAGRYAQRWTLAAEPGAPPVSLDAFADRASLLAADAAQLAAHRRLLREAYAVFGPPPFAHYDFLLALSDNFSDFGLEHLQSSENSVHAGYFSEWGERAEERDLLAHELTHAWNGKFRRPADLWTPNYNVPMQNSLLWVYEGLTEFYGDVLATRSGLWSAAFARDALAQAAAIYQYARAGRRWRSLQDTTNQPIVKYRAALSYSSWQRGTDYYSEGMLLWLDVDSRLRELSADTRSLDDFARAFFATDAGRDTPSLYDFADVVAGLDALVPGDWQMYLRARLDGHGPGTPLDGLERSGWQLVFDATPSAYIASYEKREQVVQLAYSIGLEAGAENGVVTDVVWDGPAFKAGLSRGQQIIAVNWRAYSPEVLREAVRATSATAAPLELLVRNYDEYRTVRLDYHDGARYPHLERIAARPDRLATLLRPRTAAEPAAAAAPQ